MRSKTLKSAVAVAGTIGVLAAATSVLPRTARADDSFGASAVGPAVNAAALAADPDQPTFANFDKDTQFTLSPQLQQMLGTKTITAAGVDRLRAARPSLPGDKTPPVGTQLYWPALDEVNGGPVGVYLKQYTLRGVGDHIEVWVASGTDAVSSGTAFPAGDCRDKEVPGSTEITDAEVNYLIGQFSTVIYPRETKAFSTPPDRPGLATIPGLTQAGLNFAGDGDNTVTLIDNVRDPNFYDFPTNRSYIAGFFAPIFNEITDRNVMTIDAFDWLHRTGANPKDEPDADLCKSRPARPFTYEGTFGHEWQHLLHSYQDSNETTWMNEGLSMFAESLDGYADATRTIDQTNSQGDLNCFQGWSTVKGKSNPNPLACGGPQNSLTMWGDEGEGSEILADYGNAWSFMLFLFDRYGLAFMSALHRDGQAQGLASVQRQLDQFAPGTKVADVLHDFQVMNLVDRYVDVKGGKVTGYDASGGKVTSFDKSRVTSKSLNATLNLANPTLFDKPGAAPNGADYIVLRNGKTGGRATSLAFSGAQTVTAPASGDSSDDPTAALDQVFSDGSGSGGGAVANWHLSLVGINPAKHSALVGSTDSFTSQFDAQNLAAFKDYPILVAIVSHDNPVDTDTTTEQYAPYTLTVNGREVGA